MIRTIGDPVVRFREDPVRILRAAKFAGRLGFDVEEKTLAAMAETSEDLVRAAPPRVLEEILRLLRSGHASDSFRLLDEVRAIEHLVPVVGRFLADADDERVDAFWALLRALDAPSKTSQQGPNRRPTASCQASSMRRSPQSARTPKRSASSIAEDPQSLATDCLPRRDSGCLKRACGVQHRFAQAEDKRRFRAESILRPYFEESLMLFTLRTVAGDGDPEGRPAAGARRSRGRERGCRRRRRTGGQRRAAEEEASAAAVGGVTTTKTAKMAGTWRRSPARPQATMCRPLARDAAGDARRSTKAPRAKTSATSPSRAGRTTTTATPTTRATRPRRRRRRRARRRARRDHAEQRHARRRHV